MSEVRTLEFFELNWSQFSLISLNCRFQKSRRSCLRISASSSTGARGSLILDFPRAATRSLNYASGVIDPLDVSISASVASKVEKETLTKQEILKKYQNTKIGHLGCGTHFFDLNLLWNIVQEQEAYYELRTQEKQGDRSKFCVNRMRCIQMVTDITLLARCRIVIVYSFYFYLFQNI